MNRLLFLLTVSLLCTIGCVGQADRLENEAFQPLIGKNGAQLIDVRTAEEFAKGHLVGATNIDWLEDGFMEKAAKLDKTKPVLLYCAAGGRSEEALAAMKAAGFVNSVDLKNGYNGWKRSNLPTTLK
jgi:phage shock protein E